MANYYGNSVSVIDASDAVVKTLQVETAGTPAYPNAVAVNSTTHRAYVACYVSPNIHVIDTVTDTEILPALVNPGGWNNFVKDVIVDEGLDLVYVANWNGGVEVYKGLAHVKSVPCGLNPYAMAVNPVTHKVYVANANGGSVTVIDGADPLFPTSTISVGTTPIAVAVNKTLNKIYVANNGTNDVSVINGATNVVSTTIPVGLRPEAVAVDPTSLMVYVANQGAHTVSVIEGTFDAVIRTVPVGAYPQDIAIDPLHGRVFVANSGSNNVTVIDVPDGFSTTSEAAGTHPIVVEVDPGTHKVYAVNDTSNDITVLGLPLPAFHFWPPNNNIYKDPATGITVQFETITSPGLLTVAVNPGAVPDLNLLLKSKYWYAISTTAGHTGWVKLTFPFEPPWYSPSWDKVQAPKLIHWPTGPGAPAQYYPSHPEDIDSYKPTDLPNLAKPQFGWRGLTEMTFICRAGVLSPFAIVEPADEVSTSASTPWSVALLVLGGLGVALLVRVKTAV